eukprot:2195736-Amphidinium_carterae.1
MEATSVSLAKPCLSTCQQGAAEISVLHRALPEVAAPLGGRRAPFVHRPLWGGLRCCRRLQAHSLSLECGSGGVGHHLCECCRSERHSWNGKFQYTGSLKRSLRSPF